MDTGNQTLQSGTGFGIPATMPRQPKDPLLIQGLKSVPGETNANVMRYAIELVLRGFPLKSAATALQVPERTFSDITNMINIRLCIDLSEQGVTPFLGDLPAHDDTVWLEIRKCMHYCENIYTQEFRMASQDQTHLYASADIRNRQTARIRKHCPKCPIGQFPKTLDRMADVLATNHQYKNITKKYYKAFFCQMIYTAYCITHGIDVAQRVDAILHSLHRTPLMRSTLRQDH